MTNAPALIAIATVGVGAFLLLSTQDGSGAGAIGTQDSNEGTALDFQGIGNQIMNTITPSPQDNPRAMSGAGLSLLQRREGFAATPYADHKGYSIGYGHLIKPGENITRVSVAQALDLLQNDIAWAQKAVASAITAPITQAQFDALVSFCYNVGEGAFKRSTLVKRINAGDPQAAQEFARWVYASGKIDSGLQARRRSEAAQFESATA